MAKNDLASVEGKVSKLLGGGAYQIVLDNEITITAKLCGKMQKFRIKVILGDRVTVGVSPYDVSHGLILHRHKLGSR
jgi:translation initiation factor IF-1